MQPIEKGFDAFGGSDNGVHLFFDVPKTAILSLIDSVRVYRQLNAPALRVDAPLQPHPILLQEGMDGSFWKLLKSEILSVLARGRLSRVAIFIVQSRGDEWDFRSFDIEDENVHPVEIGGLKQLTNQILQSHIPFGLVEFKTSTERLPSVPVSTDHLFDFLNDSELFKKSASEAKLKSLSTSIARIENPNFHLPGTIDCISCHATPAIKKNLFSTLNLSVDERETYVSRTMKSLGWPYRENYSNLDFRLFGYRDHSPVIGQRVINETAQIIDNLKR